MSQEHEPEYAPRRRVENRGIALFLGLFVLFWVILPAATGTSSTKWVVIALCAVVGWKIRRQHNAPVLRSKQLAAFKPEGTASTTPTPGPQSENALDGGAVTEARSGEGKGAGGVP